MAGYDQRWQGFVARLMVRMGLVELGEWVMQGGHVAKCDAERNAG